MREALCIFKKDVRHLWPQTSGFLALMALYAWLDASLPHVPMLVFAQMMFGLVLLLGCWFLLVTAIHQEELSGDRQYWVTRPMPWRSLLLAKVLFVLLFINLPVLLSQVTALLANGFSPLTYAAMLLRSQLFFTAFTLLPAAALAAVTRNLAQVTLACLGQYAAFLIVTLTLNSAGSFENYDWGDVEWVRASAVAAFLFLAAIAIFVLQYRRRKSAWSRGIVVCAVATVALGSVQPPWNWAFALESKLSDHPARESAIRISFLPERGLPQPGGSAFVSGETAVAIRVPVRVTGIPAGMALLRERTQAAITATAGRSWISSWRQLGGIVVERNVGYGYQRIPEDGRYWEELNIERAYFDKVKDTPVHLHTSFALALVRTVITRLPVPSQMRHVPGPGFCSVQAIGQFVSVPCLWLFPQSRHLLNRMRPFDDGRESSDTQTILPTFSIWGGSGGVGYTPPPSLTEVTIETQTPVSHFQRDLDIPGIVLAPYEVGRD